MKDCILLVLFFFTFYFTGVVRSQTDHQNWVHQHLVREAWECLKHSVPNIPWDNTDLASHIGSDQQGDPDSPWDEGLVVVGAYREDEEDPVYEVGYPSPTCTHFWDADAGDDWELYIGFPINASYDNAFKKAKYYAYGGHKIYFKKLQIDENYGWIAGRYYSYNSLIDFFNTGRCYYWGHKDLAGHFVPTCDPPCYITIPLETARKWSYIILGRIAHLIGDMGVPAHSHGDLHDVYIGGGQDIYEQYMNSHYINWTWSVSSPEPGLVRVNSAEDPIRYLFYVTSQMADRFPSNTSPYSGDANYVPLYGRDNYSMYLYYLANINYSYTPPPTNMVPIGDYAFMRSMQAIAGLLYWFSYYTCQYPPTNLVITPINLIGTPVIGFDLYRGRTGIFRTSINGGCLTWTWNIKMCNSYFVGWPFNQFGLHTLSDHHDKDFYLYNADYQSTNCPLTGPGGLFLQVNVFVENGNGFINSPAMTINPLETQLSGCPYIFVCNQDTVFDPDNNILHRSELPENQGIDIVDKYKLKTKPGVFNDTISIQVAEMENDVSYFDQFKLYDVEHPQGTIIAITETNEIVMFDSVSVLNTDYANLNDTDITENVQFHTEQRAPVVGDTLDHIYSHFEQRSLTNAAIIIQLEGDHIIPTPVKSGDHVTINTEGGYIDGYFSHRENPTITVIPIQSLGGSVVVNSADVDWYRNFKIRYIALTSYSTEGFTVNEIPLVEATHTVSGDVLSSLLYNDSVHVEMDTTAIIALKFSNSGKKMYGGTSVHDYIFETTGRYVKAGEGNIFNLPLHVVNKNNNPTQYKLYLNYPNPFNPKTTIKYEIAKAGMVKIEVYDILGRLVATLVNDYRTPGSYSVSFDASNFASGVYFYRMDAGDFTDVKKMVLIK